MPTGYTNDIHDGKPVTFEQFALKCSRAMGAAIMQRDESPDVEIRMRELDGYYAEQVEKASIELNEALARSGEEWARIQSAEIAEAARYHEEYVAKRKAVAGRYYDMLEHVRMWEPPTNEHDGLKDFMIEQLKESIKFDCGDYTPEVPETLPLGHYITKKLNEAAKWLARALEEKFKEEERVRSQNAWVTALRDSLKVGVS
ncbi:hypothetical protein ACSHWG_01060 [Leucobacter sp. Z1108]|uniref:hypothetical protein n=1 Tax=Leucobacter sp. Z1108 TaxID=3439066 RepID=UPI003F39A7F2